MTDFLCAYPPRELCRDVGAFLFTVVLVVALIGWAVGVSA